MNNNTTSPEGEQPAPYTPPAGVQSDYAENLAALGVKMTPDGRVKSLGLLIGEVVEQGGGDLSLETAMDWAKRAEIADSHLTALVADSARMIEDLSTFQAFEPQSPAATYALEAVRHLQGHLEKMVFGFMYGVEQGEAAKKAIFGPSGHYSG
jgi:hypothetical protein